METPPDTHQPASEKKPALRAALEVLFASPPRWVELVLWLLVIASAAGIRLYLIHLAPVGFWSKDAGSYASSAFTWLHTGVWETDPRRGAIYSLFIAFAIKCFGSLSAVMLLQHFLGFCAVVGSFFCARLLVGSRAIVPLACCCYAYAVYGLPLGLEHLVRNETLLFFFSSCAFCSWFLCLHWKSPGWLWIAGISAAFLGLTKNVFIPFPFVVVGGALYYFRENPGFARRQIIYFVIAFALPLIGIKTLNSLTPHRRPPAPQSGILLYGRTAQFTVTEGGKYPELKKLIRQDVEDYRKLPKLDNNIIIYRTVVPRIKSYLYAQGKNSVDLNRVCRELAIEAISAHPAAYLKQIVKDLNQLHFKTAKNPSTFPASDIKKVQKVLLRFKNPDPLLDVPGYVKALDAVAHKGHFNAYTRWIKTSWLFRVGAIFLTSCLLPIFIFRAKPPIRLWWIGLAAVWYFTVVLLCTIGRPMDRYMMPVVPVMFWTLTFGVVTLWNLGRGFYESRKAGKREEVLQSSPSYPS